MSGAVGKIARLGISRRVGVMEGFEKERPTVAAVGLILQGLIVSSLIYQI